MGATQVHEWAADATVLGFDARKKGSWKWVLLEVSDSRLWCKLGKPIREEVGLWLRAGRRIRIQAETKLEFKSKKKRAKGIDHASGLKRKIVALEPIGASAGGPATASLSLSNRSKTRANQVIQVCTKGNCWKRGGRQLWQHLAEALEVKGLSEQVQLKGVHCLGRCKHCPNVRCLPNKTIHQMTNYEQAEALIERHYGDEASSRSRLATSSTDQRLPVNR